MIFGWNTEKIFSSEYLEEEALREKSRKKFEYKYYLAEKTPWFVEQSALCIADLPNINFLATGVYDKSIRLWDLRSSQIENAPSKGVGGDKEAKKKSTTKDMYDSKSKASGGSKKVGGAGGGDKKVDDDDYAKEPSKILLGHTKAVREIAYNE